jgi:hypothetical protein
MIISTEVDLEAGDTTIKIDLGDKVFCLKVNLKEIRGRIDAATSNILVQKATELVARALGLDINIEDKKQ